MAAAFRQLLCKERQEVLAAAAAAEIRQTQAATGEWVVEEVADNPQESAALVAAVVAVQVVRVA